MNRPKWRMLSAQEQSERDGIVAEFLIDPTRLPFAKGYGRTGYLGYEGLRPEGMRALIGKGYADPNESQNGAPTIEEMTSFCERHPGFSINGYLISGERPDCRVSAVGISGPSGALEGEGLAEFVETFKDADGFQIGDGGDGPYYCWYD